MKAPGIVALVIDFYCTCQARVIKNKTRGKRFSCRPGVRDQRSGIKGLGTVASTTATGDIAFQSRYRMPLTPSLCPSITVVSTFVTAPASPAAPSQASDLATPPVCAGPPWEPSPTVPLAY